MKLKSNPRSGPMNPDIDRPAGGIVLTGARRFGMPEKTCGFELTSLGAVRRARSGLD